MIPLGIVTGWLKSVIFVSVLSVYALYQNAVQRIDQLEMKAMEDENLPQ